MAENIKKYLKYAKGLEVKPPSGDIDDKIIYKVSHIDDKEKVLDENFLEWLKNNNSRYFLVKESIKNSPARLLLLVSLGILVSVFIFSIIRNITGEKDLSSSSKDQS